MAGLPPSSGESYVFNLRNVETIEEAERIAGFKARRPSRGVLQTVAVGLAFDSPVILVVHRFGPGPNDREMLVTDIATKVS